MKTISGEKAMPENNQVIRLKRMLNSSAFSQSEVDRTLVWLESEQATEEALSRYYASPCTASRTRVNARSPPART